MTYAAATDGPAPPEQQRGRVSDRFRRSRVPVTRRPAATSARRSPPAYDAGVNTYIVKPVTFLALVRLIKVFTAYSAELPRAGEAA